MRKRFFSIWKRKFLGFTAVCLTALTLAATCCFAAQDGALANDPAMDVITLDFCSVTQLSNGDMVTDVTASLQSDPHSTFRMPQSLSKWFSNATRFH